MRLTLALFTILAGAPAFAHIGHLADVAGHGHWAAAGAIAIALGIAALGVRKGKSQEKEVTEDDATDEDEAFA